METLMWTILLWIGADSSYNIPGTLPEIQYHTKLELRRMLFCENLEHCDDARLPDVQVAALFSPEKGIMFLRDTFQMENPKDESAIVHELTHFVQAFNGKFGNVCIGLLQKEAYGSADKWSVEHGHEAEPMTPMRMFEEMWCGTDSAT